MQVEGLGDMIHAETEAQRKQALRQMQGDLFELYSKWRQLLIKVSPHHLHHHILYDICHEVDSESSRMWPTATDVQGRTTPVSY